MPVPKDLENQLLAALNATMASPPTRHDLARRFGVSSKTIGDVLEPLVQRGVIERQTIKTARGQNAFGYSANTVKQHTDRLGRIFYMATCTCGQRRRLKAAGPYYILWHAGCGVVSVDIDKVRAS